MIDPLYIVLPFGGAFIGFLTCAALTSGKVQELIDRIERALACETPKAAYGVRKMAAILRGER